MEARRPNSPMIQTNGFKWPDGYQSCATYTIDFDASSHEHKELNNVSGNMSVGDYARRGTLRLLDLFEKHEAKVSFFIPGWVAERFSDLVKDIHQRGHDIAGHGYIHENSADLTHEQKIEIYKKTRNILSDITGAPCSGLRPIGPAWPDETIKELSGLGMRYFFTNADTYYPSKMKLKSGEEIDMLELNMHWALDDARFFWIGPRQGQFRSLSSYEDALEIWIQEFDTTHEIGGCYHLSFHPRASGRASTIRIHDKLLTHIKRTPGVWFAPVSEIAEWVLRKQPDGS